MTSRMWSDLRDLYTFAQDISPQLDGLYACFELRLDGPAVDVGDSMLTRVCILQQLEGSLSSGEMAVSNCVQPCTKGVLRLPYAVWNHLGSRCQTLRALWTQVCVKDDIVVLDATVGRAFVAGDIQLQQHECIQVAEVFCGGFAGWTQAAWSLSDQGVRLQTSWLLDLEETTEAPLRAMMPDLQTVTTAAELDDTDFADGPVLLLANFEHAWWQGVWGRSMPQILVCSPPCQPWSAAGHQKGLDSADGRLLLRLAALLRVVRVPIVCLEEVAGFSRHPDYTQVMQAWEDAGYLPVYHQVLQLAEVAPTRRARSVFVFVHRSFGPAAEVAFRQTAWHQARRPNLVTMHAIFPQLPRELWDACQLDQATMETYLDPWYLPPGYNCSAEAVCKYRLCNPSQQAKCFMACYHRQHQLPPGMLERGGLLCSLLATAEETRFFSSAEIASCHGAQRLQLLLHDDEASMRIHGNCLAVPQAMLPLAHTVQFFPGHGKIDPAAAVHHCIQSRLHACNTALFYLPEGWLLVHHDVLGDVLSQASLRTQLERGMQRSSPPFARLKVCSKVADVEVEVRAVHFSTSVQVPVLLDVLQIQPVGLLQQHCPSPGGVEYVAVVRDLEPLWLDAAPSERMQRHAPIQLCTPAGMTVIQPMATDLYHQLKWAFDRCRGPESQGVACMTCYGTRLQRVSEFPPVVFVAAGAEHIFFSAPSLDSQHVAACAFETVSSKLVAEVPEPYATAWWVQLPYHLLECVGWAAETNDPPTGERTHMQITLRPAVPSPLLSVPSLRLYLRELLFLSHLRALAKDASHLLIGPFLVQVDARALGELCLPSTTTPAQLENWWSTACRAAQTWPGARLFSGPRALLVDQTLAELLTASAFHVKRRNGLPLLTVMPEVRGGGVKDENTSLAKSKLASLMLDRGVPLDKTQTAVDAALPVLGTTACLQALSLPDTQAQWRKLASVAQARGHSLPSGDNRTERAAQRIQKAVRKKRLERQAPVDVNDFQLVPDTWCGMDHQPVPVLDSVSADCTGAVLLDATQANAQDLDLLRNIGSEALCIVVPGHRCPDPDTCSGRTSVPVCHRLTGRKHLIAACYHNVGETDIAPHFQHGGQVSAEETVCCSFTMFQDDFPAEARWSDFAAAPVRSVVEAFRARGLEQVLHNPWGRVYRACGRPSQPHLCDQFTFFAKVPSGQLRALLQQSGFNKVYVVPRTWDRQLLQGWAVVWLNAPRGEIEKQALLVPEQHGLVRGKNKYGLRVPDKAFRKVFTQLRPGAEVPDNLDVRATYKVGPFPAAASAEAIREWSRRIAWPTKVIKSLGPQFWLLGSELPPPDEHMIYNQSPVLATEVKGRESQQPVVQAGGPLPRQNRPVPSKEEVDPWLPE